MSNYKDLCFAGPAAWKKTILDVTHAFGGKFTQEDICVSVLPVIQKAIMSLSAASFSTDEMYYDIWLSLFEALHYLGNDLELSYYYKSMKKQRLFLDRVEIYLNYINYLLSKGSIEKASKVCNFVLYHEAVKDEQSRQKVQTLSDEILSGRFSVSHMLHGAWLLPQRSLIIDVATVTPGIENAPENLIAADKPLEDTLKDATNSTAVLSRRAGTLGLAKRKRIESTRDGDDEGKISDVIPSLMMQSCPFKVIMLKRKLYYVLGTLGQGATSVVHKVVDSSGNLFALKMIKAAAEEILADVCKEITILNQCKNFPHAVQLLEEEFSAEHSAHLLLLEYGDIDAARMLKEQIFKTYHWFEMCKAVHALHSAGILHCDVKPCNFVLVQGRLKIIDFGISKHIVDVNDQIVVSQELQVGTINYMAPEALRGFKYREELEDLFVSLGTASDVWSLGCILFEYLFGKTPFQDYRGTSERAKAILSQDDNILFPESTTKISPLYPDISALMKILQACLKKDHKSRPGLRRILKHYY